MTDNATLKEEYIARARNELTEHIVYRKLAAREKNSKNRELLERLSAQENAHYAFWQSLIPDVKIEPRATGVYGIPLMRAVFGVTFTTKFLESHEEDAIATYEAMIAHMPQEYHARMREIIEDEKTHERGFIDALHEARVSYIGFIALGLADAIVEITGVHAGFLGVTGQTLIAGIAGVIVGFSAAISMGSAAFFQAKQDPEKSPVVSAFATGLSYLGSVILLALPYFLIRTMLTAFTISTLIGVLLLGTFTFFSSVINDRAFWHEIGESVALMLATALASYVLGTIVGALFHTGGITF